MSLSAAGHDEHPWLVNNSIEAFGVSARETFVSARRKMRTTELDRERCANEERATGMSKICESNDAMPRILARTRPHHLLTSQ